MKLLLIILACSLLALCSCNHHRQQATVEVIDTSLSITPRAKKSVSDAVQQQIARMQRGDLLVIIPITGDAANNAGGRVLRLSAPIRRESYDADLRRFQVTAQKRFTAWVAALDSHQSRTDILGALDAARQEFAALPIESNHRLIVVSDFLEDDGTYRFVSDGPLANPVLAHRLAVRLREQHGFAIEGIALCLGRLESSDFAPLPQARKQAVDAFWSVYFAEKGYAAEIHFDGTGMLADPEQGCFGENR